MKLIIKKDKVIYNNTEISIDNFIDNELNVKTYSKIKMRKFDINPRLYYQIVDEILKNKEE